MKTCKIDSSVFEDIVIEGVRFSVEEPKIIAFNGTDDLACVDIDSWFLGQLKIVWVNDDYTDIPIPARLLDSPIVNGGKPWIVAIVEYACQYAAEHGIWEDDHEGDDDKAYDEMKERGTV